MIEMFSLVMRENCLFHVTSSRRIEFNWGLTAERYCIFRCRINWFLFICDFVSGRKGGGSVTANLQVDEQKEDVLRHFSISREVRRSEMTRKPTPLCLHPSDSHSETRLLKDY